VGVVGEPVTNNAPPETKWNGTERFSSDKPIPQIAGNRRECAWAILDTQAGSGRMDMVVWRYGGPKNDLHPAGGSGFPLRAPSPCK
jgi:hypothetical protein